MSHPTQPTLYPCYAPILIPSHTHFPHILQCIPTPLPHMHIEFPAHLSPPSPSCTTVEVICVHPLYLLHTRTSVYSSYPAIHAPATLFLTIVHTHITSLSRLYSFRYLPINLSRLHLQTYQYVHVHAHTHLPCHTPPILTYLTLAQSSLPLPSVIPLTKLPQLPISYSHPPSHMQLRPAGLSIAILALIYCQVFHYL